MDLSQVFTEGGNYFNESNLYISHFNTIPNSIREIEIDSIKANRWFIENYKSEIKDCHYIKRFLTGGKKAEYDEVYYVLYDDLMVNINSNDGAVVLMFRKTDINKVEDILTGIQKFKERKRRSKPKINILVNTLKGMDTIKLTVSKPRLNIEDNYNEDFKEIHQTIFKRLSKRNDKGLVLLHGKPGTGKTSYIRYLIASLKKEVIFLPPNMADAITNPNLISILVDNPDSVFVIEDAENIIVDRDKNGSSAVSALLNISDGLLADCLNIQIICSFNTDISKVDNALMRKGRLIAKYEFKELEIPKANALSKKLGFDSNFIAPMSLAAIYNQDDKDFQPTKRNSIGFKSVGLN